MMCVTSKIELLLQQRPLQKQTISHIKTNSLAKKNKMRQSAAVKSKKITNKWKENTTGLQCILSRECVCAGRNVVSRWLKRITEDKYKKLRPRKFQMHIWQTLNICKLNNVLTLKNVRKCIVASSELATFHFSYFPQILFKAYFCCTAWAYVDAAGCWLLENVVKTWVLLKW